MSNDLKNSSFMGFETFFNNARMVMKMQLYILVFLLILQIVLLALLFLNRFTESQLSIIFTYLKSFIVFNDEAETSIILGNQNYTISYIQAKNILASKVNEYKALYLSSAKWTFLIYFLYIPINLFFYKRNRKQTESKFIKGAKLVSPLKLEQLIGNEKTYLPFGEVNMPTSAEVKHTLIIGRPGVGKTVAMSKILDKIITRGDRAIIHDFKGDYLQKFYHPDKDIIFNPLDDRSHYWNFFNEIESPVDVDAIGYALIPDAKGAGYDPFWNNAARDVFTGVVNYCVRENKCSYQGLYEILTSPSDIIADYLKFTEGSEAGATTIADPESKQTGSIMSVLTQYTKIFAYMKESDNQRNKKDFSINQWLEDDTGGNIYITNYASLQNTLAPILTLMIDLMGRKLLSMKDNPLRRVFFMLDEFGALQKMQTITSLLTLARSKGGGVFIGIQDLGQIDKIYGKESKQTIVNACGSSMVFAIADAETAEALSKKYGEYLSIESYVTQSMGVQNNRDGVSINQTKNKERIVMPSEITQLPDLNCFIQFPGLPVAKTKHQYQEYFDKNEPFIERSGLSYKELLTTSKVYNIETGEVVDKAEIKRQYKDEISKLI